MLKDVVRGCALFLMMSVGLAQPAPPRWQEFPAPTDWQGPNAPVKFARPDERMFRTRLTAAAKLPPNFAAHYQFVTWGCGSVCAAGAIIDLKTGTVYPPPKATEGRGWDRWIFTGGLTHSPHVLFRLDSRLMIVHRAVAGGMQEQSCYEWTGIAFRLIATKVEKMPR
jgi:hypothetical protein